MIKPLFQNKIALITFTLLTAGIGASPTLAATFTGLGDLTGGTTSSGASALSDDGATVVGTSNSTNGNQAFRWTAGTGIMEDLGKIPTEGFGSGASGVSANGNIVVGGASSAGGQGGEAFSWTQAGGMVGLGRIGGNTVSDGNTSASDISADGSFIVGTGSTGTTSHVITANPTPMASLLIGGIVRNGSSAVSGDGSTIIGVNNANGGWFINGGTQTFLEDQSGVPAGSGIPNDISHDGSVIVGTRSGDAFRWDAVAGWSLLDPANQTTGSSALAVSADGSVIVGTHQNNPMIWDEINGIRNIADILIAEGVDLADWELTSAVGITGFNLLAPGSGVLLGTGLPSDQWIIAGNGLHNGVTEAWYATISATTVPEPGTAALLGLVIMAIATRRKAV